MAKVTKLGHLLNSYNPQRFYMINCPLYLRVYFICYYYKNPYF